MGLNNVILSGMSRVNGAKNLGCHNSQSVMARDPSPTHAARGQDDVGKRKRQTKNPPFWLKGGLYVRRCVAMATVYATPNSQLWRRWLTLKEIFLAKWLRLLNNF